MSRTTSRRSRPRRWLPHPRPRPCCPVPSDDLPPRRSRGQSSEPAVTDVRRTRLRGRGPDGEFKTADGSAEPAAADRSRLVCGHEHLLIAGTSKEPGRPRARGSPNKGVHMSVRSKTLLCHLSTVALGELLEADLARGTECVGTNDRLATNERAEIETRELLGASWAQRRVSDVARRTRDGTEPAGRAQSPELGTTERWTASRGRASSEWS